MRARSSAVTASTAASRRRYRRLSSFCASICLYARSQSTRAVDTDTADDATGPPLRRRLSRRLRSCNRLRQDYAGATPIVGPHAGQLREDPIAELIAGSRQCERRVRMEALEAAGP